MLKNEFKFFQKKSTIPYRNKILNKSEAINKRWFWVDDCTIPIFEPDGFLRVHTSSIYRNTTFIGFLSDFSNYEIYIYCITRKRNNHRLVITKPLNQSSLYNLINYENDNLDIEAILI